MKSPLPTTEPPIPGEENKHKDSEAEAESSDKKKTCIEKDSGYSDSSSDSTSSEETTQSTSSSGEENSQTTGPAQAVYAPIYILQNLVLKQPQIILVQPPLCRHHKRATTASYLPILRSYPKIAPRIAPDPTSPPDTPARSPTPPACKPPNLLEVSLRSLALLRRTRETQRSIRELKAHAILYERALRGEEGGWERLQRAMEKSGAYRKMQRLSEETSAGTSSAAAEEPSAGAVASLADAEEPSADAVTSLADAEECSAGATTSLAVAEPSSAAPMTSLVGVVASTADTMSSLVEEVTSVTNTVSSLVSCPVTRDDRASGKTEAAMTALRPVTSAGVRGSAV